MSQAGVFTLITKDARFDRLLYAQTLLRERLARVAHPRASDIAATHWIPVRATYRPHVAVACEYTKVNMQGGSAQLTDSAPPTIEFDLPATAQYTADILFHVELFNVGTVNFTPGVTPLVALCALPGLRLFQSVQFTSDKVLIDDYTSMDYNLWSKFFVDASTNTGWRRSVGQQVPLEASCFNPQGFTQYMLYADGAQTPKYDHGTIEMFVPAQFSFCADPGVALANEMVGQSERRISLQLARLSEIVSAFALDGTPAALPFAALNLRVTMYVNQLTVEPWIYDILQRRRPGAPGRSMQLLRVHRRQQATVADQTGQIKLDKLKYPGEFLLVGAQSPANLLSGSRWPLMGAPRARTDATALLMVLAVWNAGLGTADLTWRRGAEATTLDPLATQLGLTTRAGVQLLPLAGDLFYNAYLPLRFVTGTQPAQSATVAPRDRGAYLLPLCVHPGNAQPSGHLPFSALGGEVYLQYVAPTASATTPVTFYIVMQAINFLVRNGTSVRLRYSL